MSSTYCIAGVHYDFLLCIMSVYTAYRGVLMIRCHLSRLMGEKKVKFIEVARDTGISRNMISSLYHEKAKRIDFDTLYSLCTYFDCEVGDLFEVTKSSDLITMDE